MKLIWLPFFIWIQICFGSSLSPVIPNPLGVNIHFTDPLPGELEELAATRWNYVRIDFFWQSIEQQPGVYDFSKYDSLLSQLQKYRIKPIFILDYTNPLYDNNLRWELYNEPNIPIFWSPYPNVTNYALLALAVGQAVKSATPNEFLMGPATSQIDFSFLESSFQEGILEYFDAVSIHPYRSEKPETVIPDYARLNEMIQRYKPAGKTIPIICSEWGYSTLYPGMNLENQGKVLPRMMLVNLASYINVSIWYDWHNDCNDSTNLECNFGTVYNDYHPEEYALKNETDFCRPPVYTQKPNYISAQVLMELLNGLSFETALNASVYDEKISPPGEPESWFVFKFSEPRNGFFIIAAWSTSTDGQTISIDLKEQGILAQCFHVTDYLGEDQGSLCADSGILLVTLQGYVIYLIPQ